MIRPMPIALTLQFRLLAITCSVFLVINSRNYVWYCDLVRGRLLIFYFKQSVIIQNLDSGGRGRQYWSFCFALPRGSGL